MDRPFDVVMDTLIRIDQDYAAAFARRVAKFPHISKHFFQDGAVYALGNMSDCKEFANKGFIIVGDEIYICRKVGKDWYQTGQGAMI